MRVQEYLELWHKGVEKTFPCKTILLEVCVNKKEKNIGTVLVEVTKGWQIGEIFWMREFVDT